MIHVGGVVGAALATCGGRPPMSMGQDGRRIEATRLPWLYWPEATSRRAERFRMAAACARA
jgi:hypothetical protein